MKRLRIKALVLAAGRGERLDPLTGFLPKPLLPVAGKPVVAYTLSRLAALGCEATALNLHYLGHRIEGRLGTAFAKMPLVYSHEEEILGTLGALAPLRDFLARADLILVLNGDSLCRWPLKKLVRHHLSSGAEATLLLSERADVEDFGGGVGVDESGRVTDMGRPQAPVKNPQEGRRYVFAGAQVLSPHLLDRVEEAPGDLVSGLYLPLLVEGKHVGSMTMKLPWHDLGTPRRYLRGARDWAQGRFPRRLWRRSWIGKGAQVGSRVRLRSCVVESGAKVERRSRLENSLIFPGAMVGEGSHLTECIVASDVSLPPGTSVQRRLMTALKAGRSLTRKDSVLGQIVYTPMDEIR